MGKIKIQTRVKKYLSDLHTPVSIYLKVRDQFAETVLLESTDFRSRENCFSFIGVEPIAKFLVQNGIVSKYFPDGTRTDEKPENPLTIPQLFDDFIQSFDVLSAFQAQQDQAPQPLKGESQAETPSSGVRGLALNGFFGHTAFDAIQYFDTIKLDPSKRKKDLPDLHYSFYRFVIAINHFNDEMTILENIPESGTSEIAKIETFLQSQHIGEYTFRAKGMEESNLTDDEFKALVRVGKQHCQVGDVFQIVFSRQFSQAFEGDEFQVYRALRSINPSPYLFFFDYGTYKIFGSSPEQHLVIQNRVAKVNPIAGTYLRTGDDATDSEHARALAQDPKEVAEHIMLVDLARNDLGKHSTEVKVQQLKEIQYFSHVIHLVSRVEGTLAADANPIHVFADTFPAGTLSGAPKYKALELINHYENQNRYYYGGAIGYIGFDGNMNQAIVIRSFLSRDNVLYRQAGAGIVAVSDEATELQEVNNKLGALKKAIIAAEK